LTTARKRLQRRGRSAPDPAAPTPVVEAAPVADEPAPAPVEPAGPAPVIDRTFSTDDVAAYYDDWNERYEAVFGEVFQHLKAADHDQLLDQLAATAEIADGERLLDAGCGVCGPARGFARRNQVTIDAVTLSPVQAARGAELNEAAGLSDQIHVHTGDFHHLERSVDEEAYDLVYFLEALVHSDDPPAALRSAFQVLRPGGRIYIKDFFRGHADDAAGQRVIDECVEATNDACHLTIRDAGDLLGWIAEAGFEVEHAEPLATAAYSIDDGHEFCRRYDLDVAAGRDFTTTFYLENLEIRARKPR
jgi:cyclopropane fatty-acyl-phospholipid synthase-like methyltransferase